MIQLEAFPFFVFSVVPFKEGGVEGSSFFHTTEFWAALSGVGAGFLFTLFSDFLRDYFSRRRRYSQLEKEVIMIREDALASLRTHIESNKIPAVSKKSPVLTSAIDYGLVDDKAFLISTGIKMSQRRSLKTVENLTDHLNDERKKMHGKVVEVARKIEWEMSNTLICHYAAFIVYSCDAFFGKVPPIAGSVNGEQFHENNENALKTVESLYDVEIPRHRQ